MMDFASKHRASIETLKTEEDRKGFLILAQKEDQKFFALAKKIVATSRKFYGVEKPVKTKKTDVTTVA